MKYCIDDPRYVLVERNDTFHKICYILNCTFTELYNTNRNLFLINIYDGKPLTCLDYILKYDIPVKIPQKSNGISELIQYISYDNL